ncbi:MAG: antA/AntB antirepressor family protein [Methylophaga sp.]|nr:antA/AntB antirepressor family protein [Methylophaga sp.]
MSTQQATELHFPIISECPYDSTMTLSVNARDLHTFLEVESRFDIWIKRRIEDYTFVENQDFIANDQKRSLGFGRGQTDYYITLDMAKELAMVERNHKGRLARRYFIDMETKIVQQEHELLHIVTKLESENQQLKLLIPLDEIDQKIVELKALSNNSGGGLSNADIGRVCSLKKDAIRSRIRRLERLGRLIPPDNLIDMQMHAKQFLAPSAE